MTNETRTPIQNELIQAVIDSRNAAQSIIDTEGTDEILIVVCGDLPIQFGYIQDGIYNDPGIATLATATRFDTNIEGISREAVQRVARQVQNGAGTHGHAVSLRQACRAHVATQTQLLEAIS